MTPQQQKQAAIQLARLQSDIGIDRLMELAQCDRTTIRVWAHRGRISKQAAHKVCLSPDVAALGYTREVLRPDVENWYF